MSDKKASPLTIFWSAAPPGSPDGSGLISTATTATRVRTAYMDFLLLVVDSLYLRLFTLIACCHARTPLDG